MAGTDTAVSICSRAVSLLGCDPISSLEDESVEAQFAAEHYPTVFLSMLATEPMWGFTRKYAVLARVDATPPTSRYDYVFKLPTDCLAVRELDVLQQYEVNDVERQVYCNSEAVTLEYSALVKESDLPPAFVEALIYKLAAELAMPITHERTLAEGLKMEAERRLQIARVVDGRTHPDRVKVDSGFLAARGGPRRYY